MEDIEKSRPAEASIEPSPPSTGRRKVLKAALAAVPVIATVRSRPAWAAYSSVNSYGAGLRGQTGG